MLSKYYRYNDEKVKADTFDVSALNQKVKEIYSKDVIIERIHPGGTLGIFYQAIIDGKKKFIKTHMNGEMYHQNLLKEIELMKALYRDVLDISSFTMNYSGSKKEFMVMDFIEGQSTTYEIGFVRNLIESNSVKLGAISSNLINYNVDDLLNAAIKAYEILSEVDLLSRDVRLWCKNALNRLEEYGDCNRVLCHGDLSNVNIMRWKKSTVVIDWEDALLAYPEYDLLYWLTFYSQRKYYSCHLYEDIGVDEQYGKDIMVMILLIKCYMSYVNKSYTKNKLSIDDRINEIISM